MRLLLFLTLLCVFNFTTAQKEGLKIKNGPWVANLILNDTDVLPFNFKVAGCDEITVVNGEEEIVLEASISRRDSFFVRFPYFNSQLVFKVENKKKISGYWQNLNKGEHYKIPFVASYNKGPRFAGPKGSSPASLGGRWKVGFEPGTEYEYPAVGVFEQGKKGALSGTFLTETGDYRFLQGNIYGDSLLLSCFDGSHAFLFKALYKNDSLMGSFFSGNHWSCKWVGVRNETFELKNPEELTYLDSDKPVAFSFKTLSGKDYSFPNASTEGKVVIIQIMGSWCPNCLDETVYYKSLYESYNKQGLEIIAVGYESGKSFEDYASNIARLKSKLNLDFTFLVGGPASKNKASRDFSMLNAIISFPTSIFIGRDGKVKRIHTGFTGPGTGDYYNDYINRTEALIERLISQ